MSPVTAQGALDELGRRGRAVARPGVGTFVAARRPEGGAHRGPDLAWQAVALGAAPPVPTGEDWALFSPPRPGTLPLASGYPDESLQPLAALALAASRAARRPGVWGRTPPEGLEPLRAWFARDAGGGAGPADVLVVPGGQAALSTVFRALAGPGEPVLLESPTYFGAIAAARSAGLRPVPVPTDEGGARPDLLAAAFEATGARVFYCQPLYANPTGATLAPERRRPVLEAAAGANAFVVEDDYARDLAFEGPPPAPLFAEGEGRVVYVRSLTKSTAPALRVAGVVALGPALARLRAARAVDDLFASGFLQEVALELVSSPARRRHLDVLRRGLRERRDVALAGIVAHLPGVRASRPAGGFSLWLALPPGSDEAGVVREADRLGVQVNPGRPWFPAEPASAFLRLSYAGAGPAALEEGVARLARALETR